MNNFYIKIDFNEISLEEKEKLKQMFMEEIIFKIIPSEDEMIYLPIRVDFDFFLPGVIIAFKILNKYRDFIKTIETYGEVSPFVFQDMEEFLQFIFIHNKDQLLDYYKRVGYIAFDSDHLWRYDIQKYYHKMKK